MIVYILRLFVPFDIELILTHFDTLPESLAKTHKFVAGFLNKNLCSPSTFTLIKGPCLDHVTCMKSNLI